MALAHMMANFQLAVLPSTNHVSNLSSVALVPFRHSGVVVDVSSSGRDGHFRVCSRKNLKLSSLVEISSQPVWGKSVYILPPNSTLIRNTLQISRTKRSALRAKGFANEVKPGDEKESGEEMGGSHGKDDIMDEEERREWRAKIREVIDKYPNIEEEADPEERKIKMQKLLKDYPLVVEEEDPDWPEDADGRGFNLDQFFNKITIKNKNMKKDDDGDEDDSDQELVWQDDDYIRPIKDITTAEWEETVFKDISPLIVLVHNRYKRPTENQICRNELEKAVNIIWNCRLPSPRCVAIDAVTEYDLVSTLQVSAFPELIFTKAGKVLYREKAIRTADELSKIMAFFYYGAAKPSFFDYVGGSEETIPAAPSSSG